MAQRMVNRACFPKCLAARLRRFPDCSRVNFALTKRSRFCARWENKNVRVQPSVPRRRERHHDPPVLTDRHFRAGGEALSSVESALTGPDGSFFTFPARDLRAFSCTPARRPLFLPRHEVPSLIASGDPPGTRTIRHRAGCRPTKGKKGDSPRNCPSPPRENASRPGAGLCREGAFHKPGRPSPSPVSQPRNARRLAAPRSFVKSAAT